MNKPNNPQSLQQQAVIILSTINSAEKAKVLARALVGERLAACVSILNDALSVYRWEGEIQTETECLLLIKTSAVLADKTAARLSELHPYDTPEIVVIEPKHVNSKYLKWVLDSVMS